jgi:hypothetical protein
MEGTRKPTMIPCEKVKRELLRLEAKLGEPQTSADFLEGLSIVDVTHRTNWEKVDPRGQLLDVSLAIRTFRAIRWPRVPYWLPDDDSDRVDKLAFYGGSENYEVSDSHRRVVLYQFAYIENIGRTLAFNLLDEADVPLVYTYLTVPEMVDADAEGPLSELLARVVVGDPPSGRMATTKRKPRRR